MKKQTRHFLEAWTTTGIKFRIEVMDLFDQKLMLSQFLETHRLRKSDEGVTWNYRICEK